MKILVSSIAFLPILLIGCSTVGNSRVGSGCTCDNKPVVVVDSLSCAQNTGTPLPTPPNQGRTFLGLKASYCTNKKMGNGVYVIGYSYYNNESPAKNSGIQLGDKIISLVGKNVTSQRNLELIISAISRNSAHEFEFDRLEGSRQSRLKTSILSGELPEHCIKHTSKCISYDRGDCSNIY